MFTVDELAEIFAWKFYWAGKESLNMSLKTKFIQVDSCVIS